MEVLWIAGGIILFGFLGGAVFGGKGSHSSFFDGFLGAWLGFTVSLPLLTIGLANL